MPLVITIDFESYYAPSIGYGLKTMTTEEYITDPRFEVIMVGVLENGEPPKGFPAVMEREVFEGYIEHIEKLYGWANVAVLAHHAHFDGRILSYHFGVIPGQWFDSMCMAAPLYGATVGGSLAKLAKFFKVGEKGDEVVNAMGKRRRDFTEAEWARYALYCRNDCECEWAIFLKMLPGFPEGELRLIDMTIRMFTEPVFVLDEPAMKLALAAEIARKNALMRRIVEMAIARGADQKQLPAPKETEAMVFDPGSVNYDVVREYLMSNDKFAVLLMDLGVDPPTKFSSKQHREVYAFAKTDPGFQALLEYDGDNAADVIALAEARLGVKTTIALSRAQRFLKLGENGKPLPVYLRYCFGPETLVLTNHGWKPIVKVRISDLIWDGDEWVEHQGVVNQGVKKVMKIHSVWATPDHLIWTTFGWLKWSNLKNTKNFQLALRSVRLPFSIGKSTVTDWVGRWESTPRFNAENVVGKGASISGTFLPAFGAKEDVPNVVRNTIDDWRMNYLTKKKKRGLLAASVGFLKDAVTRSARRISTMVNVVSRCFLHGMTLLSSSNSSRPCQDGISLNLTSIGLTTIGDTSPETSGSQQGERTAITGEKCPTFKTEFLRSNPKTSDSELNCGETSHFSMRKSLVYDLRLAGPQNRFTILTDEGPILVHNCGAHTFRFSGGDRVNWQNLERTDKKKPEKGAIRKAILDPKGHKILVQDSSQIEARVLAWLADQEDLLEQFRQNRDIYSEKASVWYGRKIDRKKNPDDFIPGFVAKCAVLGLGYGLGDIKFASMLNAGMLGGPPVAFGPAEVEIMGVDVQRYLMEASTSRSPNLPSKMDRIEAMASRLPLEKRIMHCAVANHIVKTYRKENKQITDFWALCEDMLAAMVDGEEVEFRCPANDALVLKTVRHGVLLPSGLVMRYPDLERKEDDEGNVRYSYFNARYKKREHLYGGKFTENIDQALARIIVMDQALSAQDVGIKIATTTHDEIVGVVREEDAQEKSDLLHQLMVTPPSWCPDLPLGADGGFGDAYGDIK